jgi:hypothetical protein
LGRSGQTGSGTDSLRIDEYKLTSDVGDLLFPFGSPCPLACGIAGPQGTWFQRLATEEKIMKLGKTSSVEDLQVIGRFESLRRILLSEQYADYLDKPLAYWALPSDRRLPLAFLGRTLKDLLETSFAELAGTPGIGQKKVRSFVKLLSRVANTDPADLPIDLAAIGGNGCGAIPRAASNGFDPSTVSEVVWSQWRAAVLEHGLGQEALGRFAPTLKNMTRVIWNTPLENYARMTLAEIRTLKTHGDKRVRAILDAFHSIYTIVSGVGVQEHLVIRIVPRLIDGVESWVGQTLQTPGVPSSEQILQRLIRPLLDQVRIDATQQITRLAENRLGINDPMSSVRQAARSMGLTRARVYQLLNEINDILNVRWPMGRHQIYELRDKFQQEIAAWESPPSLDQFHAAIELFYPGSRRGAAGPLQQAAESAEDLFDAEEAESPDDLALAAADGGDEGDGELA